MNKESFDRYKFMEGKNPLQIKVLRKGKAFDEYVCEEYGKELIITKGTLKLLYNIDADKEMGK